MKQTLTNIDGRIILRALRHANPLTAEGRLAVENYRAFLTTNAMSAIALENSIVSLKSDVRDAGLEGLVATLTGIMAEPKLRVAVAYEHLAAQSAGSFMSASNECFAALEGLYERNAAEIVGAIIDGALDAYRTVPEIARLIQWAKAANISEPERKSIITSNEKLTIAMVPILNLATAGEDMLLISIDGRTFLQSGSGALTYIPDASAIEALSPDVRKLIACLNMFESDNAAPNQLKLKVDILEQIRKAIPLKSLAIDILGGVNELVIINDQPMDIDKAKKLLMSDEGKMTAAFMFSDASKDAVRLLMETFNLVERYRDVIASNKFAYKFNQASANICTYVSDDERAINAIEVINDSVVAVKSYNTIYDLLKADFVVANTTLHEAISTVFASKLSDEAKRMSVRMQMVEAITAERKEYQALLSRINEELDNLAEVVDANPDKVKQLTELKDKTEQKIADIAAEIDKLSK